MHTSYITLDGRVVDLSGLTEEERSYLDTAYRAYQENAEYYEVKLANLSTANPVIRDAGGRLTQAVWDHPLWQAVRDLEDRIGLRQRRVGPSPGDDPDREPFSDTWISPREAAAEKGVSVMAIHNAAGRGELVARPLKPGSRWLQISAASLARWQPVTGRQKAGRAGAAARYAS